MNQLFDTPEKAYEYLRKLGTPGRDIHPTAIIYPKVKIGHNVDIGPYAVIGKHGFGFDPETGFSKRWVHAGTVIIEDEVEIGAHTCIDGGTIAYTRIGKNTKIDNLVHVGHNANIGEHVLIVAGSVIGGSVLIGNNVYIGEGVRIRDHTIIGNNVVIGQGANIVKNVSSNTQVISKTERVESAIQIGNNLLPLDWCPTYK